MKVNTINIGTPTTIIHNGNEVLTSLFKKEVPGALYLGKLGFLGDTQSDLVHHGGEDKAVCVYAIEHYSFWEKLLNTKLEIGAFGENLTVTGLLESEVCIGDIYQIGEAVVQVSQPRQPCYKLGVRYEKANFPLLVEDSGYTGFYFRVLKEGLVEPNSDITIVEKDQHQHTIEMCNQIMHQDKENKDSIKQILKNKALSSSWRKTLEKRLSGIDEDTSRRLRGE